MSVGDHAARRLLPVAERGELSRSAGVARRAEPSTANASDARRGDWLAVLAIGALALLAYLPALRSGLIWDDEAHLTAPALQSLDGLRRIWCELGATQQYYPVLHSAFWLEHRWWGDAPFGYHLLNVLLHAAAACLVVAVVRRLGLRGGWLAGLIFALHPVGVESVAWITEQKNTLSAVFYLGAALAYLDFDRTRRGRSYAAATVLFLFALGAKTVTATLPAALLVVCWWKRGSLQWRRDVLPLLPWLVAAIGAGLLTAWVERKFIGAEGATFALSGLERGLIAGRALWFYFGKLLWPANLTFNYPRWEIDPALAWQYAFPAAAVVVATLLGVLAWRGRRGPLAAFLFFAGTLAPVLGFLNVYPFKYSFVADHFQYLASLGVIVPLAATLSAGLARLPVARAAFGVVAAALAGGLGALTWSQCRMYRDAETLYRVTLARNPASWMAHENLGDLLVRAGRDRAAARAHFETALRLNPASAKGHYNLAALLAENPAEVPQAIAHYREAIRLEPTAAEPHNNLGNVLARFPARLAEAIAEYETALRLRPADARTHYNLGVALAKMPGRLPDAIRHFETALAAAPTFAEAHNDLGNALAQAPGRAAEAMVHYREALRLRPDFAPAHYNLALALLEQPGGLDEAVVHLEQSLRLNPAAPEAHYNLGAALVNLPGRLRDAVAHFEEAVRLNPRFAEAHYALAVALFALPDRRSEARAHAEIALRINPDFAPARDWLARTAVATEPASSQ